ncbi:MAG: DUF1330 domain-containing protein [Rhodospirillaceae bacterium]|nr:DUF1330 domain-containing protein [Rhodospirillaceae bacterium]
MPAYLIGQIRVTDAEACARYRAGVAPLVEQYGGRFLVRGPEVEVLEGAHDGRRLVIIEFPSKERLRAFYDSADYAGLAALRQAAAEADLWAVEGV